MTTATNTLVCVAFYRDDELLDVEVRGGDTEEEE